MKPQLLFLASALVISLAAITGCGGSGPSPDFSLQAAPGTITVAPAGASQTVSVTDTA